MTQTSAYQRAAKTIPYVAPRLRIRRYQLAVRQRIRRMAILLTIGAALLVGAVLCTPDRFSALLHFDFAGIGLGIRNLPAWRVCAQYSAEGQVVYEEGPASSLEWVTRGTFNESVDGSRLLRCAPDPSCLRKICPSASCAGCSAFFLHAMRLKNGEQRLVLLRHVPVWETLPESIRGYSLKAWVVDGTENRATGSGTSIWDYGANWSYMLGPRKVLRIYAGQADPGDATHLTIPYELDGGRGIIDAWLRGNSGHMHFVVRDGPGARTDHKTQWD